jgi:flagellar hook-basal body complex protein FliE
MAINAVGVGQLGGIQRQQGLTNASGARGGQEFQQILNDRLQQADHEVRVGDQAVDEMINTQGANLHETMIALERADIAIRLTTKVGEKLVRAYKEVSQIQV